jgi:hypothetical protein
MSGGQGVEGSGLCVGRSQRATVVKEFSDPWMSEVRQAVTRYQYLASQGPEDAIGPIQNVFPPPRVLHFTSRSLICTGVRPWPRLSASAACVNSKCTRRVWPPDDLPCCSLPDSLPPCDIWYLSIRPKATLQIAVVKTSLSPPPFPLRFDRCLLQGRIHHHAWLLT